MPDTRPVWLTREQRDLLSLHGWRKESDAWDAAPADAAEAATKAAKPWDTAVMGDGSRSAFYLEDAEIAANVLRALGMPEPSA